MAVATVSRWGGGWGSGWEWWASFLWFWRGAWKSVRAVAEPPSHHKPTSIPHPGHAEYMWQLVQQKCIWEKFDGSISSFFQTCKEASVPCRKQEIPDKLVYIRACDPESMHSRTRKQNEVSSSTIGNNGLYTSIQACVLDLLTPVYMLTLALKCNTSQQLEMGLLCLSSRMTGTWKWNTNK